MVAIIWIGILLCGVLFSIFGAGAFIFLFLYLIIAIPIYMLFKHIFNKKD